MASLGTIKAVPSRHTIATGVVASHHSNGDVSAMMIKFISV